MNWFQQNRFLGTFLIVFGVATLVALYFFWSARSSFAEAKARFDENATELSRLQRLTPFPNEPNLRKMKAQAEDYAKGLEKLKEELKARVLPAPPMAPNEFQSRLRQAMTALSDKARANRVKLPDNFYLGFDEFAAALPDTAAAPVLGQEIAQVELLLNLLVDARVEAVTSLRRIPATERTGPAPSPTPSPARRGSGPASAAPAAPPLVERATIEVAFLATPGATRRVLNQISTAQQQLYVIRTLHIVNEKDKGPPREAAGAVGAGVSPARAGSVPPATRGNAAGTAAAPPNTALTFIVGNERVQTAARIEMLRFTF